MNVTEDSLKAYIQEFHSTLDNLSSQYLDSEKSEKIFYRSLLPAKITCYVSTQFGVAFEYSTAQETSIETVHGSARVEDLLVNAPRKIRDTDPLLKIASKGGNFIDCHFKDRFPFHLSASEAKVTFRKCVFSCEALRWSRVIEYAEIYGNRDGSKWSRDAAQSRAKDVILAALFEENRAKSKKVSLQEYINTFHEKHVLVLGSYDENGKKRLDLIGNELKSLNYEPILIKDIPDFEHYDLPQKVTAIGAVSRFIVIDDTEPSGHLSEVEICKFNRWVTVLLRLEGQSASWMTQGASITSNVIFEKNYDLKNLTQHIKESVSWAESTILMLKIKFDNLFPWRRDS